MPSSIGNRMLQRKPGFDGFAKADFISQHDTSRVERLHCSAVGVDLMRIQLNVGVKKTVIGRCL